MEIELAEAALRGFRPEYILLAISLLFLISILAGRLAGVVGAPLLLAFLGIGMLAGSEGLGGIYFDDPWIAQFLGVSALVVIIFSGGLENSWSRVRPVLWQGAVLATLGVAITAGVVGAATCYILGASVKLGMLLGAIVSSTDAAAVFSVLGSGTTTLKPRLGSLLEFESGSNDPMAVFLTMGLLASLQSPDATASEFLIFFAEQMSYGLIFGMAAGRGMAYVFERLQLNSPGLYPVLALSMALFTFGVTASINGSGFLAVYIAGITLGGRPFKYKKSVLRFHESLAWLMQIIMFLILGLLVFPKELVTVIWPGLALSAILIFVARPLSVFLTCWPFTRNIREMGFLSWVGLRGAVPIILATFPLLAEIPQAQRIFNIVFFIVLTSALLQGSTIPLATRFFRTGESHDIPEEQDKIGSTPQSKQVAS
ncbi:potassium/proton antiporter [Desulfovibrio inopinatus]|uniref:potassium/proton antiporter n=1 Tax=Desulfovibrio inopinatus TaxID=102109 RepID=UPI000402B91F|nr:potassium/proton antiporter [Desulfovibrio inopinatus]